MYADWLNLVASHTVWGQISHRVQEEALLLGERRERSLILDDAKTRYLQCLADFPGIEARVKQYDIASYLGITPVALSRLGGNPPGINLDQRRPPSGALPWSQEEDMKALTVDRWGTMTRTEGPWTPVKPGLVRVKVKYAGVGRTDITAVRGGYLLAPRRPSLPGYEFVGTDEAGVRVAGLLPAMGAYQEFIDLDGRLCVPVPEGGRRRSRRRPFL